MSEGLPNCAHCDGQPNFIANRFEAVIVCTSCGISTPPHPLDAGHEQAYAVLRGIWELRVRPLPFDRHELSGLVRKGLTSADLGSVLALIANNEDNWAERGPLFAAMAARLLRQEHAVQELMPPETMLRDASRYRQLLRRARILQIDGRPWIYVTPFEAHGALAEVADDLAAGDLGPDEPQSYA